MHRSMSVNRDVKAQLERAGIAITGESKERGFEWEKGELFVKVGKAGSAADRPMLEYTAEGLRRLAAAAPPSIVVPTPWLVGETVDRGDTFAFIAMDRLALTGSRADLQLLGSGLADLHLAPTPEDIGTAFGFVTDGYCGTVTQPNNTERRPFDWVEFWKENRLGHQLRELHHGSSGSKAGPLSAQIQELGRQLATRLKDVCFSMLIVEDIRPALLHGKIWPRSYTGCGHGCAALLDPACYYGHYEADHGINAMFGGTEAFTNSGYCSKLPREAGYERRAKLYELHHHLNHENEFGGYASSCVKLMQEILK